MFLAIVTSYLSRRTWLASGPAAYDAYAARYDDLDGGPVASSLRIPEMRRELVQRARGDVLEVAAGTGLNLGLYTDQVRSLTLLDASAGMLARAQARGAKRIVVGDAAKLPFDDATFDTVVSTFSLCTFDRPLASLEEMRRVVKKNGSVLLLENTRPDNRLLGLYVDLTADLVADRGGKGCRYNIDVPRLLDRAGFEVIQTDVYLAGFFKAFVTRPSLR